jgi:ABC-type branched-subunit amino acid transport system permease subunit
MQTDWLTCFELFAIASMLACYALEDFSAWFVLGCTGICALGSVYCFLQGAWPFGLLEAMWSLVSLQRCRSRLASTHIFLIKAAAGTNPSK